MKGNIMLCIKRKQGESFTVGEATIHIGQFSRGEISIFIDAPKNIPIVRDDAKCKRRKSLSSVYDEPGCGFQ